VAVRGKGGLLGRFLEETGRAREVLKPLDWLREVEGQLR